MYLKRRYLILQSIVTVFIFSSLKIAYDHNKPIADEGFTIAILPDTQYYTSEKHGGKKEMFFAQTDWIVKNAARENIAYVVHLGDISDDGEKFPQQ